jgi:osmotically-inducible protein OsmY
MDKAGTETRKAAGATKDATMKAGEKTKDAASTVGEKTKAGASKVGEKTKDVAGTAGEKSKDAGASIGEAVTDAWITTKLKADFVNEATLKGSDINVDTNNHVVTLKGTVASAAGRTRAAQIAKTTKGVRSVVNTLTVAPK